MGWIGAENGFVFFGEESRLSKHQYLVPKSGVYTHTSIGGASGGVRKSVCVITSGTRSDQPVFE